MVGGVAVLTLLVGLAWKVAQEHEVRNSVQGTLARELTVTDANGAVVLQGSFERQRRRSGGNSANGSLPTACALPSRATMARPTCWR